MIETLRTKIYSQLNSIAAIANKVFYAEAVTGTTLPYAVFFDVVNNKTRDTGTIFEETYLQVSIFTKTASEVNSIGNSILGKIVDKETTLTTTDWIVNYADLQFSRTIKTEYGFQGDYQFRLFLTKK